MSEREKIPSTMLCYNQFIPQAAKLTKLNFSWVCIHHLQQPLPPAAQDKPHGWGQTAHSPSWRENNFTPFWQQANTALFVNKPSFSLLWDCTMILQVCCHLKGNFMYICLCVRCTHTAMSLWARLPRAASIRMTAFCFTVANQAPLSQFSCRQLAFQYFSRITEVKLQSTSELPAVFPYHRAQSLSLWNQASRFHGANILFFLFLVF